MCHFGSVFGEGVSALDHETVDDAVEKGAVVVAGKGQFFKVVTMFGRILVQFHADGAHVGNNIEDRLGGKGLGLLDGGDGIGRFHGHVFFLYDGLFLGLGVLDPVFAARDESQSDGEIKELLCHNN